MQSLFMLIAIGDSHGYSRSMVDNVHFRRRKLRKDLQTRGSESAKRHLKEQSGKERRFDRDFNHQIAKQVEVLAEGTARVIAVEEPTGNPPQDHGWAGERD